MQYALHPDNSLARPAKECPAFPTGVLPAVLWFAVHHSDQLHPGPGQDQEVLRLLQPLPLLHQWYKNHATSAHPVSFPVLPSEDSFLPHLQFLTDRRSRSFLFLFAEAGQKLISELP